MATVNGIEAVELLETADPAAAQAAQRRGHHPVVERSASDPRTINGIEGVIFSDETGGPGSLIRLDDAEYADAYAAQQRGQRPIVVVDEGGAVVASGPRIQLSGARTLAENAAAGATVGTLSVSNGSGTYTFSLTDSAGNRFAIDGDDVERGATGLDYEAATSHTITVEADNGVDAPITRSFAIAVTNVLDAATLAALTLSANTVAENTTAGTVIGAIQNKTSGSSLSLTDDAGGRVAISGTNLVTGLVATNYESATSHNFTIRETLADSPNSPRDTALSITVTDVDEVVPTITSGSTASVAENATLSHSLTANETVTWSIVGGADQGDFEISGSTLRWLSNGVQDFEAPADANADNAYVVTVRATDTASNTADQTITVTVTDVAEGGGDWWDDSDYDSLAVVADFNNDRYALPELGSELVTNGDFASSSGWTLDAGVTISGGVASKAVTVGVEGLYRTIPALTSGKIYVLTFTILNSTGSGNISATISTPTPIYLDNVTGNGTYTQYFTATDAHARLAFAGTAATDFDLDNVSLKEVTLTASGGVYPKREATFDEVFAYTAASTAARTYVNSTGVVQTMDRTNLALQSEDASTSWSVGNTAVTSNSTASPTGTTTGDTLTESGSGSVLHLLYNTSTISVTATVPYTFSRYYKDNGRRYLRHSIGNAGSTVAIYADVDLQSGTIVNAAAVGAATYISSSITSVGSGWYRVSLTGTITGGGGVYLSTILRNASTNVTTEAAQAYDRSGGSLGVYVWGAQMEVGIYAQTYVPTTTVAVDGGINARRMTYANSIGSNLLLQSQARATTWNADVGTVTSNTTIAPDGTVTADTLTSAGNNSAVDQTITTVASTVYTFSDYIKPGTSDWAYMQINCGTGPTWAAVVYFNVATGAVGSTQTLVGTPGTISLSTVAAANGFYRCIATFTNPSGSTTTRCYTGVADADNSRNSTSGKTVYQWGAQLEASATASAYVTTTTTAVYGAVSPLLRPQLRLENAGTNLKAKSQNFNSGAPWTVANHVSATAIAPNGTATASEFAILAGTGGMACFCGGEASGVHTASVFAKAGGSNFASICWGSGNHVVFNLTTGAITRTTGSVTGVAKDYGNGWWRLAVTATSALTADFFVFSLANNGTPTVDGYGRDTSSGVGSSGFFWGAQVELSPFVTNYIPTTSAAVTRAIETCRLSPLVEAILQRTAGSVVARVDLSSTTAVGNRRIVGLSTNNAFIYCHNNTTDVLAWNGANNLTTPLGSGSNLDPMGAAMGFDASGRSIVANGGTVGSDANAAGTRTVAYLGRDGDGSYADGYYDFVGISPERLADATLQALAVAA